MMIKLWKGGKNVISNVHQAEGKIGPQIWHPEIVENHASEWYPSALFEGPSTLNNKPGFGNGMGMADSDIADPISAFGQAAANAKGLGFDTLEFHGAHQYLIDQFFWEVTNKRGDKYGGKTITERTRFATEVIKEVRRRVADDFAIKFRISQLKIADYNLKLAKSEQVMEQWLTPLADAGVDIFHCSQRRFWEPEFEGYDLNLAGWAKKITGEPTITVGSVGLDGDFFGAYAGESSEPRSLEELIRRLERGDFDLVAFGRPLLADSEWAKRIKNNEISNLLGFKKEYLKDLI